MTNIYIYKIIGETERNSNQNSKLEFQFCVMCPKLFILKDRSEERRVGKEC